MKIEKNLSKGLAQSAYVMNVISGGMTQVKSLIDKLDDHLLLQLEMSTVDPDSFSIELDHNDLFVYQLMDFGNDMEIPYLILKFMIPSGVNSAGISADYVEGKLNIVMPYSKKAGDFLREIEIRKH